MSMEPEDEIEDLEIVTASDVDEVDTILFAAPASVQTVPQKTLAALSEDKRFKNVDSVKLAHANQVFFDQLYQWSAKHLPMGSQAVTQKHLERGVRIVGLELRNNAQKYGIDPITAITLVSAVLSIIHHLIQWWNRRDA